jgi:hypothetical protein
MGKTRKIIMEDPTVRAAVEALKDAVLSVNGDVEVTSFLLFIDARHAEGHQGSLAVDCNICPCPKCLTRLRNMFFDVMGDALQSQEQTATRH